MKAKPSPNKLTIDGKIAITAIVISLISALIAGYDVFRPGIISPMAPAGFAIIRGDGSFPSDLLVLPLEWENTSGRTVLIRHPTLVLHELDSKGKETGNEVVYTLAGEFAEISSAEFQNKLALKYSFILHERSVDAHVFAFHYKSWWNEIDENYSFRFKANTRYRVSITYQINGEKEREQELFILPIYERVDDLELDRTKAWWDYFYLQ